MVLLLVVQLGGGVYAMINYDKLVDKGLTETLRGAKDNNELFKVWEALQYDVSRTSFFKPLVLPLY